MTFTSAWPHAPIPASKPLPNLLPPQGPPARFSELHSPIPDEGSAVPLPADHRVGRALQSLRHVPRAAADQCPQGHDLTGAKVLRCKHNILLDRRLLWPRRTKWLGRPDPVEALPAVGCFWVGELELAW